jgi:hypothetical protein
MMAGVEQVRRDLSNLQRMSVPLAIVLAISPAVAGLARNSWTAAGSDSYAYVTQADLWLQGTQTVAVPIADAAPWPEPVWTFTPYGYRPAAAGSAIVPMTSPGLSVMMAMAKKAFGHAAMFWVVPLTGALLVWMTFLIGRRLRSPAVGLGAAWLMATSPAFLAMLVSPMSDVPAAAFWAMAIYFTLGASEGSAVTAGLAAAAAILVRANLAPLAAVLFIGRIILFRTIRPAVYFAAATATGCLLVAWLNATLYGSPFASGYGDLSGLFSLRHVPTNVWRYGAWFVESQTPVAALGVVALFFQSWLLASFTATVAILYLAYTPFEAWWYLRFLLPAWPGICVGTAALLLRPLPSQRKLALLLVVVLIALGIHGIRFAATHGAFPTGEGDHRYASIGKLVEQFTAPSAVILAGQNSGPTRYYGGRVTMRFDTLDALWLDRAVTWLSDHGRRPYFLLEEWELPLFQERFAKANRLGALALTPVLVYQAPGVPGQVYLFDPARPDGPMLRPGLPPSARPYCVEPAPPVMLNLQ